MKFSLKVAALFLAFLSGVFAQQPILDHLTPDHLPAGSGNSTITAVGANLNGSNVLWDGVTLTTTHINSNIVTAVVPSTNLSAIGTHAVTISGGSTSNVVPFHVLTPLAPVDSYTPTLFVSGQDAPVTVNGGEFTSNATILFDWQAISTTFVSSHQLQGTVPGSIIGANVPHRIAVYNGAFLGGSLTVLRPQQINLGTISISAPVLNFQNGIVVRDTAGTVTLGSPWYTLTGSSVFSLSPESCRDGLVLVANAFCQFTVTATPVGTGAATATLTVFSDATNSPQFIPLSVTGSSAKTVQVAPSSLAFGAVALGATTSLGSSISSAFGSFTLSSPYYTLAGSGDFTVTGGSCVAGGPVPCTTTVTFAPLIAGNKTATLTVNSGADNVVTIALSGTGTSVTAHTVKITWTASTSAGISGYNVYRAVFGSSFSSTPLNGGTPVNALTYTDTTVTAGTTYIYGVTAVAASESAWPAGTESTIAMTNTVTP